MGLELTRIDPRIDHIDPQIDLQTDPPDRSRDALRWSRDRPSDIPWSRIGSFYCFIDGC